MKGKPYIIGLTGGIASGKTAVSEALSLLGAKVIDADIISREIAMFGKPGYDLLKKAFPEAFDGEKLNRRALRETVFGDSAKLEKLNAITHPLIISEIKEKLAALSETDTVLLVAPLLFETGLDSLTDLDITVTADESVQVERLMRRDGVSEKAAKAVIAAQMSEEERIRNSAIVIANNGSIEQLREKAAAVYKEILARAR